MKYFAIIVLSFAGLAGFAQKDQWADSGLAPGSVSTGYVRTPASITQSNDTSTITAANSVACPGDNDSYMRRFDLDGEFGITGEFTVESVDFGVETNDTTFDLTVNLYTIPNASALEFANLTLIGTAIYTTTSGDTGMVVNAPVAGVVADPTSVDLVVEVFAPDFTQGANFFIGSNANGQTAPSFLASAVCGATEPTDTAVLGFPGMQIVMIVNGDVADCMVTSIVADNTQVVISGNCLSGLDVWCQSPTTGDVLVASGVVVDGSASVTLPGFTPDAVYYTTAPGEMGIGNAIDGVVSNRAVPTLGEWSLLAFITLLMAAALVVMKKQRYSQV